MFIITIYTNLFSLCFVCMHVCKVYNIYTFWYLQCMPVYVCIYVLLYINKLLIVCNIRQLVYIILS